MLEKLRKIHIKNSVIEIVGITLIIYGLNRLSLFLSVLKFEKKLNTKFDNIWELTNQLSGIEISDIIISQAIYGFIALVLTSVIITFIKVKNQSFYFDSIVVFLILLLIFPFFINRGMINKMLFYVSRIWETNLNSMSLISFIIFTLGGIIILWNNINGMKSTTHNK